MELGQHIYLWYDLGVFNLEEVSLSTATGKIIEPSYSVITYFNLKSSLKFKI